MNTTTQAKVTTPDFKLQWDETDFRRIKVAIKMHFARNGANTKDGHRVFQTFGQLDECFGLAFTSSSSYAMFNICNTAVYLDYAKVYTYQFFAIDTNNVCYAILWDKEENELIIKL